MSQPLILTLQMDEESQAFYEDLRQRYFPPKRNLIPAHLTLFHHLPDEARIRSVVREVGKTTKPFGLTAPSLRSIGRGVAVFFNSAELMALQATLVAAFEGDMTSQDRQRLRPHIVVQNKVDPATARETLLQLEGRTFPTPRGVGLTLWRYLDGPWEWIGDFAFEGPGEDTRVAGSLKAEAGRLRNDQG